MALTITHADGTKTPYTGPFPGLLTAVVITVGICAMIMGMMMLFAFVPIAIYALASGLPVLGLTMLSAFRLTLTADGQEKVIGLPNHPVISIVQAGLVAWCAFGLYPDSKLANVCFVIVAAMAFIGVISFISGKFLKRHTTDLPGMHIPSSPSAPIPPQPNKDGLGRKFY